MSHLGRLVGYFHVFSWQNPVKEKTVSEVGVNPEISRDTLERLGVIYALQSTCLSCQSWRTALAWNVTLAIGCDRGGGGLSLLSESNFYCSFLFLISFMAKIVSKYERLFDYCTDYYCYWLCPCDLTGELFGLPRMWDRETEKLQVGEIVSF